MRNNIARWIGYLIIAAVAVLIIAFMVWWTHVP